MWAVTNLGDIFVSDRLNLEACQLQGTAYINEIDLACVQVPLNVPLHGGCVPGTKLTVSGCIGDDADRIAINLDAHSTYKLRHKAHTELQNTCLHFNPRFNENIIVRNTMIEGKWGDEEKDGGLPIKRGQEFTIEIECFEECYVITINDLKFCTYKHRLSPCSAIILSIWGKIQPFKFLIKSPVPIVDPRDIFWRQIGGHLRRVESCSVGVTWGIGNDHTAWVYNGGWGGSFVGSLDSNNVNPMTDSQDYRVYENQRWNPVTGYTSTGQSVSIEFERFYNYKFL